MRAKILPVIKNKKRRDEIASDYRSIFENALEGIFRGSVSGKPLAINPALAELLGYDSPDDLLATVKNIFKDTYASLEQQKKVINLILKKGLVQNFEVELLRKDKTTFWASVNAKAIRNKNGKIVYIEGLVQDISDRKKAEDDLVRLILEQVAHAETEKARRQVVDILESISDAFIALDNQLKFTYVNKKAEQLLEKSQYEIIGQSILKVFPKLRNSSLYMKVKNSIKQKKSFKFTGFFESLKNRWLDIHIYSSKDGLSIYFEDITKNKLAEDALRDSEERLRLLLENIPDYAIFTLDNKGNIATWNKGAERLFGYQSEEIIGKEYGTIYSPDDVKNNLPNKLLIKAVRDGKVEDEGWRRKKNGWYFWANPLIRPLKDDNNILRGFVIITRDITEKKRVGETILFQKILLESQSEASPDGILIIDNSGKVLSYNHRFSKLWNIPQKIMVKRLRKYIIKEISKKVTNSSEFVEKSDYLFRNPEEIDHSEILLKDGRIFERYSSPIKNNQGVYYGRIWFWRNITERKLEEKQREFLVGVASHELKTPITTLKAFNQLLGQRLQRADDNEALHYTNKMGEQLDRLTGLVRDLLDVVKLRSGRFIFQMESVDINKLIESVVDETRKTHPNYQIDIYGKIEKEIVVDQLRIQQVLSNLISNAIKYSPKHHRVIIKLKSINNHIKVSVQDFGLGIPKNKKKLIFDPFYRISDESRDTFPGMGLGLFISSEIIKSHGGKIKVKSIEGKGSTFYFCLPVSMDKGD